MAMFRGLPPLIEPIDSDKNDEGGKIKYWRLREILPSGFISQANPSFSPSHLWSSTSHFQLQNNYWSLTAYLDDIDFGSNTLTINILREYSFSYYATHAFADPRKSLSDLFTVLIGIGGESGEVVVEKAKPVGRSGFEVYRLIDDVELNSILKSKAPYFLFVEIERKDITEEKQKAGEKERKNYRCERFENALRICNGTLLDPDSSNASSPAMMGPSVMGPPTMMSPPGMRPPTRMSPPGMRPPTMMGPSVMGPPTMMSPPGMRPPTKMSHPGMRPPTMPLPSVIKETPKYVTPSPLYPSLNSSLPTSRNSSTPATTTTVMFPSQSMSSTVNGTPTFLFPSVFSNPSFPNSTASLPARPPNPSLPTSNISHSFSNQLEEKQVPNDHAQSFEHDTLEHPVTFLERYLSTTTTPGLFPSIAIPSAITETPPSLNPSLFKSPASLPARPPNPSLPTTKTRKFQMDYKDLLLSGKGSDFTIIVKDMKFHAHKIILGARSSVFLAMTEPELTITDVDPVIFREFLLYLYTGHGEHIDGQNIMELYKLGDKYCVEDLKELCLERMKTNLSMENFFEIFMLSQWPFKAELSKVTIEFFLENSKEIIGSDRYKGFMRDYPDKAYLLTNALVAYANAK